MQCSKCNTDNDADSRFCKKCGHPLEEAQAASRGLSPEEHIRIGELIYSAFKHKESGDIEKAILACQGALALNDASPQAHVLLATLYQSKGDIAAAMYEYERALDLDPQNLSTKVKLDNLRDSPVPAAAEPQDSWLGKVSPYAPVMAFGAVFVIVLVALTMFFVGGSSNQAEAPQAQQTNPQTTAPIQPYERTRYPQTQTQTPMAQQQYGIPGQAPVAQQPYGMAPATQQPYPGQPAPTQVAQQPAAPPAPAPAPVPRQTTTYQRQRAPIFPITRPAPVQVAPRPQPIFAPIIVSRPTQTSHPSISQPPAPKPAPQPVGDPEQRAVQLQRDGKYDEAISAYKEALNRTSDSGRIYQQIGLCNQRLGKRSAAVNSYNQAIRSYRDQLAAGRDPAEVQRNIRACEAGIAVSKGP